MDRNALPLSSQSSMIHPASRVDQRLHHPALLELLQLPTSWELIDFLTDAIFSVVQSWCTWNSQRARRRKSTAFTSFAFGFIQRSGMSTRILLVALAYVDRLHSKATIDAGVDTEQHLFDLLISSVIVAHKYVNDSTMKLSVWTACTPLYDLHALKLVERKFLSLIKFDLKVDETELLVHYDSIMARCVYRHVDATPLAPSSTLSIAPFDSPYLTDPEPCGNGTLPRIINRVQVDAPGRRVYLPLNTASPRMAQDVPERPTLPHLWEVIPYHLRHAPLPNPEDPVVDACQCCRGCCWRPRPIARPSADLNKSFQFWIVNGFAR